MNHTLATSGAAVRRQRFLVQNLVQTKDDSYRFSEKIVGKYGII